MIDFPPFYQYIDKICQIMAIKNKKTWKTRKFEIENYRYIYIFGDSERISRESPKIRLNFCKSVNEFCFCCCCCCCYSCRRKKNWK